MNEALETHVVKYVNLLAVRRPDGGRVVADESGKLFGARNFDSSERFSLADSFNLAEKETIDLRFDSVLAGSYGLVIGFRASLLTTYLLY